jgi:hypothetical protein
LQIAQTDQTNTWELVFAGVAGEAEQRFEMRVDEQPDGHFATVLTRIPEQRDEMRRRDFVFKTPAALATAAVLSSLQDASIAAQNRKGPFDLEPNFWGDDSPIAKLKLRWDTPIANISETQMRGILSQMGLTKESTWTMAFDLSTATTFKSNLEKKGWATTARGLIEFLNMVRMVRFLSLEVTASRKDKPKDKLTTSNMLTTVFRVWTLMDRPNLDLIPAHILFSQTALTIPGAGIIHPDDILFRLYMKKLTEADLFQLESKTAAMEDKTLLSTIGQNLQDSANARISFANDVASVLLPPPVAQAPDEIVDLIPAATTTDYARYVITDSVGFDQSMQDAQRVDEMNRAIRLKIPEHGREKHPLFPNYDYNFRTLGDLRLILLARARAMDVARTLEADVEYQKQLKLDLAIAAAYASENGWETEAQTKYGQPYKPMKKLPVPGGDLGYYQHNMLVIAQQLIIAMKYPAFFESYANFPGNVLERIKDMIKRKEPQLDKQDDLIRDEIMKADPTYNLWTALARQFSALLDNLKKANTYGGHVKYYRHDIGGDKKGVLSTEKVPDLNNLRNLGRARPGTNRLTSTGRRQELRPTEPLIVDAELAGSYTDVQLGSNFTISGIEDPKAMVAALAGGIADTDQTTLLATLTTLGDSVIRKTAEAVSENENLRMAQQALSVFSSNQPGRLGIVTSPPDGAADVFPSEEADGLATLLALNLNQEVALIFVTTTYVDASAIYQRVEMRMNALFGVALGNRLTVQAVSKANVLAKKLSAITSRWSKRGAAGTKPVFLAEGETADLLNMDTVGGVLIVGFPSTELQGAEYSVLQRFVATKVSQFADKLDEDTAAILQKWGRGYKVLVSALQQMMASLSNAWQVLARIRASA